jgi:hypothetical protein
MRGGTMRGGARGSSVGGSGVVATSGEGGGRDGGVGVDGGAGEAASSDGTNPVPQARQAQSFPPNIIACANELQALFPDHAFDDLRRFATARDGNVAKAKVGGE